MILVIDFETRSRVDLRKVGADKYAADPSTEVICLGVKVDDEPSRLWIKPAAMDTPDALSVKGDIIDDTTIKGYIDRCDYIYAHNVPFELAIWNNIMESRHGFGPLPIPKTRCIMALGYYHTLPGKLEKAGTAIGAGELKDA